LVTIADMGRFLSNGIVWIHSTLRIIRRGCYRRLSWFFRFFLCRCCIYFWRRRMRRRRLMQQSKAAKSLAKNKSATATTIAPSESTVSGLNFLTSKFFKNFFRFLKTRGSIQTAISIKPYRPEFWSLSYN